MEIRIKKVNPLAKIPKYETIGAAGFDLASVEEVVVPPKSRTVVKTGLVVDIPQGFEIQIRGRSGLTLKTETIVHFGTIDSDYLGEIGVIMINTGDTPYTIKRGDRIAQGVLAPVARANFIEGDVLKVTKRGSGGYGSTGND